VNSQRLTIPDGLLGVLAQTLWLAKVDNEEKLTSFRATLDVVSIQVHHNPSTPSVPQP